jgi:polyprenyl P-hydroxybenzoate/phenylacrylic acid decarboxylase-like protein
VRRKLVLVAREAPLSEIHLENMHYLARLGAVIFPPTVAYYARPTSVDEVTNYVVGRVVDQFGIEHSAPTYPSAALRCCSRTSSVTKTRGAQSF